MIIAIITLSFFAMVKAIPASHEDLQEPEQKVGKVVDHQIIHEHKPVTHHAKVSAESQGEAKHIVKAAVAAAAAGGTSHSNRPQKLACAPGECGQDPSRPRKTSCHNCGDH